MSDNQVAYLIKLKNGLCCYIQLLDAINTELKLKSGSGRIGTSVSEIAVCLFQQLIDDPQITLFDECGESVCYIGLPVTYYGVRMLECNGDLIDQYHTAFTAKSVCDGGCGGQLTSQSYLSDLINPDLELGENPGIGEVVCDLKNHFIYIREIVCHQLKRYQRMPIV